MNKLTKWIIWINFGLILISVMYYGFVSIYPYEVIKINNPLKILTPVVKAGDRLIYIQDVEKFWDIAGTKNCRLEDGVVYYFRTTETNIPVGKSSDNVTVLVAAGIPEGVYDYVCDVVYNISGFRQVKVQLRTEPFRVTK